MLVRLAAVRRHYALQRVCLARVQKECNAGFTAAGAELFASQSRSKSQSHVGSSYISVCLMVLIRATTTTVAPDRQEDKGQEEIRPSFPSHNFQNLSETCCYLEQIPAKPESSEQAGHPLALCAAPLSSQ